MFISKETGGGRIRKQRGRWGQDEVGEEEVTGRHTEIQKRKMEITQGRKDWTTHHSQGGQRTYFSSQGQVSTGTENSTRFTSTGNVNLP